MQAVRRDVVWPARAVAHVRKLYEAWDWPSLRSGSMNVVSANNVSLESLGSNDRFILVLRDPRDGASVRFQPTRPMHGVLMDAMTGETLRVLRSDNPATETAIDLPRDSRVLLLAMQSD